MRRFLLTLTLLTAVSVSGQEGDSSPDTTAAPEQSEEVADYTPDALRLVLRDVPDEEKSTGFADQGIELLTSEQWTLRFMPLTAPLRFAEELSGPVTNQLVDPFTLLGVEMAPAGAAGDEFGPQDLSWRERWYRWRMISFVNAENRRQNELFHMPLR